MIILLAQKHYVVAIRCDPKTVVELGKSYRCTVVKERFKDKV